MLRVPSTPERLRAPPNLEFYPNMCLYMLNFESSQEKNQSLSSKMNCRSKAFYRLFLGRPRHAAGLVRDAAPRDGGRVPDCGCVWLACGGCCLAQAGVCRARSFNVSRDILSIRTPFRTPFSPTNSYRRDGSNDTKITFRGCFEFYRYF